MGARGARVGAVPTILSIVAWIVWIKVGVARRVLCRNSKAMLVIEVWSFNPGDDMLAARNGNGLQFDGLGKGV